MHWGFMMSTGELDPKFRIRAPLRCDGVGSLDCAEDVESGVRMAIRWLPVDANGEAAVKAVEAQLPRHPVLPRIRQTGRVGSAAYVAMEFPEGRLLSTLLPDPQPADDVVRIGAAVADAMAVLHAQQVVHGELSADSVLMLPENKAVLWDVPLVMANRLTDRRGEERELAQLIRVAPYLSPERARGLPASAPSDVYALGALMCIAAGGQTPPGGTTLAVVHQIASREWTPELPRAMSPTVSALVRRMIAHDPFSRPTAREVADTLGGLLQARPTLRDVKLAAIPNPVSYSVLAPPPLPTKTDPEAASAATTDPTAEVVPPPLPGAALSASIPSAPAAESIAAAATQKRPAPAPVTGASATVASSVASASPGSSVAPASSVASGSSASSVSSVASGSPASSVASGSPASSVSSGSPASSGSSVASGSPASSGSSVASGSPASSASSVASGSPASAVASGSSASSASSAAPATAAAEELQVPVTGVSSTAASSASPVALAGAARPALAALPSVPVSAAQVPSSAVAVASAAPTSASAPPVAAASNVAAGVTASSVPLGPAAESAPIAPTTLEDLVAPSIVLEPELAAAADALRASRRQRLVLAGGAVAIAGLAAMVIGVVALRGPKPPTQAATGATSVVVAPAALSDSPAEAELHADPDVAELVVPLVGASSPSRREGARPASATKRSIAKPSPTPARATASEAEAVPARATSSVTETGSPSQPTAEPASAAGDFSFLEQNVAAPKPGELKRPSF